MLACPKCEYVRSATDDAPEGECPKCGVIYAKALQHQENLQIARAAQELKREQSARRRKALMTSVVCAALVAAGIYGYKRHRESQRAERQRLVEAGLSRLSELKSKWEDASKLASSTSRIALAGPVESMQDLQRQVKSVSVPACLQPAKDNFSTGAKAEVDMFLMFMQRTSEYSEPYQNKMSEAVTAFTAYSSFVEGAAEHCADFVQG